MNALVLGHGRSGKAAEALLCRLGFSVMVLEGEAPFPDDDQAFEFAVVSPGIALTHPWIAAAQRCALPLKSELQLGCEELKRQGWRLLAVTGSKGKSSVVKLVAEALGRGEGAAVACGNYGLPVCEVALANCGQRVALGHWAVVEVSSFMLETTCLPGDAFEAAAILNLQADHLDRHGSLAAYHALKRKLLTFARTRISEAGSGGDGALEIAARSLWAGSYFDNEVLAGNAAMAVALLRAAGLAEAQVAAAFQTFQPLPHRMNTVAEIDGVRYVDDSKATSIAALVAGVKMAAAGYGGGGDRSRRIRLIAGGLPKGDDPLSAGAVLTELVKKVYLIGQCAEALALAWKRFVDCEICETLDRAVGRAKCEAGKGETVLLSPGTASFDQFKSYEERGEVFASFVKKER